MPLESKPTRNNEYLCVRRLDTLDHEVIDHKVKACCCTIDALRR